MPPTSAMSMLMLTMATDKLNSQLDTTRMRVIVFSALQGLIGLFALVWSFIGRILDATYNPHQTMFSQTLNGTARMMPLDYNVLPYVIFYDTLLTGAAMLVCCLFGLLFCTARRSASPHDDGDDAKSRDVTALGGLPLYVALSMAAVAGSFYLVHRNMLPFNIAHPWELLPASSRFMAYYACRLAVGALGLLVNLFAIDAALRQIQTTSHVWLNSRLLDVYEDFAVIRGGVSNIHGNSVIAAVEQTARNSVSTIDAPNYATAAAQFPPLQSLQQHYRRHHEPHPPRGTRVMVGSEQQVVEMSEQVSDRAMAATSNELAVASESEEIDDVVAVNITGKTNNNSAAIISSEKIQASTRVAAQSVDNESQSGAAVVNATRRSMQSSSRLSR